MARRDLDQWLWQVGAELQRLSEEVAPVAPKIARRRAWEPAVDILESDDFLLIKAELAGVRSEDVRLIVQPEQKVLTIRGVRHPDETSARFRVVRQIEIFHGEFERPIALPEIDLDLDDIRAEYRNGYLFVAIPKTGANSNVVFKRTITVKRI
ncbi:MAG: Hsp20/alpha crystallin family protein [Armatimonadetes bacterium]|nr:Hsp20/alpha crystallin family protein [Armatimonadota bacterium]